MRLRKTFRIEQAGDDALVVTGGSRPVELHFSQPDALEAVRSLSDYRELSQEEIELRLSKSTTPESLAEWLFSVGLLHDAEALEYRISDDIYIVPNSAHWPREVGAQSKVVPSRFATIRFVGEIAIVESPLAYASLHLHSADALLEWRSLESATTDSKLSHAVHVAGLSSVNDAAAPYWSRADATMHAQSRISNPRAGARASDALSGNRFVPDVTQWLALPEMPGHGSQTSLDEVLKARRSRRAYGSKRITLNKLSELLARSSWEKLTTLPNGKQAVTRPYPSGGNLHSLDLYLAVSNCDGLEPGLYIYDRQKHALGTVSGPELSLSLVRDARRAAFENDDGQVLLLLAANFEGVTKRYESIAYSLLLKEVGAALQTIHLVATDLNLAACPIGTGDSALFARAVGSDPFHYTSVGELLIGMGDLQ